MSDDFTSGLVMQWLKFIKTEFILVCLVKIKYKNILSRLTEVTWRVVSKVPVELCAVCFLQSCAQAKIRQLYMSLHK